jgi:hypothetical protein
MAKGIRLWLDDNRSAPEGWVWARNVRDAAERLMVGNVDELSLDFDLDNPDCPTCQFRCGLRDHGSCDKQCACHQNGVKNGAHLVEWMTHTHCWPKNKPIVHSVNGAEAEQMKRDIDVHFPGPKA